LTQPRATRRFNVEEYHAMARVGILGPDERVELLEGEVVPMDATEVREGNRPVTRRFTVEEYYAMVYAGILHPDERVELIEGGVVPMPPIGSRHNGVVAWLTRTLTRAVADDAIVLVQGAVRVNPYSEPQPDLAILRARPDYYRGSLPGPGDVLFLIEVAETSILHDRNEKIPLYALAGIPEVWLVNLEAAVIEVFRAPEGTSYREQTVHPHGEVVRAAALPAIEVRVEDVLG
jgi:Uma2 family endonuclease